ncbi:MAG: hypothetical protein K2J00_07010 [Bacteroidaceae bacterium]|nr:hypothetical protein [Bacteroidaceae bacterium]
MAFNLNDPGNVETPEQQSATGTTATTTFTPTSATQTADAKILGLSETEIKNPETIVVTVSDPNTPVVVLFGARTSGKTMTLIRLAKYLEGQGYNIVPDPIFRPDSDSHYQRMCKEFGIIVHSDYAATGTDVMSFMLVKVISPTGRTLCQILEAPGEHYFDADTPNRPFPAYIEKICKSIKNRKTWVFIVEENWGGSQNVRDLYANKIQQMQRKIARDRVVFACNKVDQSAHFRPDGHPNVPVIFQNIKNQYPHIFDQYANRNPITSWFKPYNFDFITFSAGAFNSTGDGRQVYTPGEDIYPQQLWQAIKKNI